jgi:DNA-binding PadR family transcriptional regulator
MPAVGPLPRFAETQVRRALELIAENEPIGRKRLVEELSIGEGSVRTILDRLKRDGLIKSSRRGHELTARGRRRIRAKAGKFVQVDAGGLTVGRVDIATLVRGAASKVKRGIEQRDEAIKAGADGATVLVFRHGKIRFPDEFARVKRGLAETLVKTFNPRERDVIIIGTAQDPAKAEEGAKAAARAIS